MKKRPSFQIVLQRGWSKRCPHCGEGTLFSKGVRLLDRCEHCGTQYLRNQGDHWAFLLVVDRAFFILPLIAIIYFDLLPESDVLTVLLFACAIGVFIATTGRRFGVCIGLEYLSRFYWGDPPDRPAGS